MAQINPYINFYGNVESTFHFYKSIFGGEIAMVQRFKNIGYNEFTIPVSEANKITHIALPIGKNILKENAVPESMGRVNEDENRSKIIISAAIREEVDPLFKKTHSLRNY